ncbi:AAA family ATPase [Candidatus Woesearchaeota archaeon]|nr:AAA family ATPase [Candidatus Woesearchaeota archaeon]
MRQYHIQIGGAKRSGKTTLAKGLLLGLDAHCRPALLEVDDVKNTLFGADVVRSKLPDTPESLQLHATALRTMFGTLIPKLLYAGRSPIVIDTHDDIRTYQHGKALAHQHGVPFKFLFVESPTLEEATLRARRAAPDDPSDMKDFANPKIVDSFLLNVKRMHELYGTFQEPHCKIQQGAPESMWYQALAYILH